MISFVDEAEHQFCDLIFAILGFKSSLIFLLLFFLFFFSHSSSPLPYSHISCCDTTQEPIFFWSSSKSSNFCLNYSHFFLSASLALSTVLNSSCWPSFPGIIVCENRIGLSLAPIIFFLSPFSNIHLNTFFFISPLSISTQSRNIFKDLGIRHDRHPNSCFRCHSQTKLL